MVRGFVADCEGLYDEIVAQTQWHEQISETKDYIYIYMSICLYVCIYIYIYNVHMIGLPHGLVLPALRPAGRRREHMVGVNMVLA